MRCRTSSNVECRQFTPTRAQNSYHSLLPHQISTLVNSARLDSTMSRNELIQSAISFLRDPTTQSSSLQQKIAFLESKGLTQPEIAMALSTSSSSSSSPGVGYGGNGSYGATMPTEFKKDWRDWFIIGVVVGSTGYVAISLIKVSFSLCVLGVGRDYEGVKAEINPGYHSADI